jgi:hypothetical protein
MWSTYGEVPEVASYLAHTTQTKRWPIFGKKEYDLAGPDRQEALLGAGFDLGNFGEPMLGLNQRISVKIEEGKKKKRKNAPLQSVVYDVWGAKNNSHIMSLFCFSNQALRGLRFS